MNKEELKNEIIKTLRDFKAECYDKSKDLSSKEDLVNQFKDLNHISSIFSKISDIFGLIDELDVAEGKDLYR